MADASLLIALYWGSLEELVCFINYVLIHPDYHGRGIAGHLLELVKEAYKSYLYINVM